MGTTRMFLLITMLLLALEGVVGEAAAKKDADTKKAEEAAAKKDADKKAEEPTAKKDDAEKKAGEAAAKKDEQELAKRKAAEKAAAKEDADKKADEAAAKKAFGFSDKKDEDADAKKYDAEKKAGEAAAKKDEQELAKRKAAEKAAAKKDADKKAEEAAAKKDEQELAKRKAAAKEEAEELQKRKAEEKAAAAKKAAHEAAAKKAAAAAAAKTADKAATTAAPAVATTAVPVATIDVVVEKPVAPVRRHLVLAVADVEAFIADASELLLVTKAIAGSLGVTTAQVQDVRITQAAAPTVSGSRLRRLTAGSVDVAFTCVDCRQGTCQEKGLLGSLATGAQKVTSATCLPQKPPCVPVVTTITTTPAPPVQTDAPCTTAAPAPVASSDPCATQAKKFSQDAAVHLGSKTLSSGMLWLAVPALLGMILLVRAVSVGRCRVPDPCSAEDARSMTTLLEEVPLGEHEIRDGGRLATVEAIRFSSSEPVEFLE